jgi:hypothetical protein
VKTNVDCVFSLVCHDRGLADAKFAAASKTLSMQEKRLTQNKTKKHH